MMLSRLGSGCDAVIGTHDTRERTRSGKEKRWPNEQRSAERGYYFQRFCVAVVVAEKFGASDSFSLHAGPDSSQNGPKSGFGRLAGRHPFGRLRSKYFKKSEKKACQPPGTPVNLTAKPNQTIGETNDKKRTAHVRIPPHSCRSCRGNSSRNRG